MTDDEPVLNLGTWAKNQRVAYRNNELSTERIDKLDRVSFMWSWLDNSWDVYYDALCRYAQAMNDKDENG